MASQTLKRKAGDTLATSTSKTTKTAHNASITSFFGAPKSVVSSTKPASTLSSSSSPSDPTTATISSGAVPKFDKQKWISTLSPETKGLLKLEIETLDESYLSVKEIREEVVSRDFLELKKFLKREIEVEGKKVFPPLGEVYSWSRHTPLNTVKVVILGQDPYHNHNQAHGLCFSVRPPTAPPPSLKNMYIALKNDYPSFTPPPPPNTGLLTPWAERGVLMLNTCLTVRAHDANSHAGKGWERFTQKIIDVVAKTRTRGVVFLAWGTPAAKRVSKVDKKRHHILQAVHPSPLSAHRGFFECGHFRKCNDWLAERYTADGIIDWNLHGSVVPISAGRVDGGKVVGDKTSTGSDKSTATSNIVSGGNRAKEAKTDEFGLDDDEEAIEALNSVAEADALSSSQPQASATQEGDQAEDVNGSDAVKGTESRSPTVQGDAGEIEVGDLEKSDNEK